jgi:hypothetical protein
VEEFMKLARFAPVAVSVALAVGLVYGIAREASAQSHQTCHMRGVWNGAGNDVFEFDAAYVYNHGEDDFTGIHTNPGVSQANISASARGGTWNIQLSYIDHAHRGWVRKLVGTGMLDGTKHGIAISGTFKQWLPGASHSNESGTFVIDGKCR